MTNSNHSKRAFLAFSRLSALSLLALAAAACSAGSGADGSSSGSPEQALSGNEEHAEQTDAVGAITVGDPYVLGSCTDHASVGLSEDRRSATVIFSNQEYGGDPASPDYWQERSEGRLIGDAKSTALKCELHVPMKITAGYRFSPTNVVVRGFGHHGMLFGQYRWLNAGDGYTFEGQVPPGESANSPGNNFTFSPPLSDLWSPTCSTSAGKDISAELVVSIVPYTTEGVADSLVAVDSFDVIGLGSVQKCGAPVNYDPVAQEGGSCGVVDGDNTHPVRCDTSKQTNVCVYYITDAQTGVCVNVSKPPSQSEREVGFDDDCGGPFYEWCSTKDQPLVCRFVDANARQNASSHFGRCSKRLAVGEVCDATLYGACNGNTCNSTLDPCVAGATCTGGKCVAH